MRHVTTAFCCICLTVLGWFISNSKTDTTSTPQNAVSAAVVPNWNTNGQTSLPLDLILDSDKRIKTDTIVVRDTVTVTKIKRVKERKPFIATDADSLPTKVASDSLVAPVKQPSLGAREDEVPDVKLIINGNTVYTSKDSLSVSDEP